MSDTNRTGEETADNTDPSSLRILLWDIDGTLMRSVRQDAYKDYTAPMLEGIFGTSGRLAEMRVSGMTDLQIVAEALRDSGITQAHISDQVHGLRSRYMLELERVTGTGEQFFHLLPGVHETLKATSEHSRYRNALLTGNMEPAARLKIRLVGLSEFFQLPGAFGDDSYDRRDLPAVAHDRISRHLKMELAPSQFIVIGDTPNDIACARHYGSRSVAVATGRMYSAEDLLEHKPDALLPNLADPELVLRTLSEL
jgi:phosphoglycolate phosphatase-like HAD superfamily hydrolase